MPFEIVNAGNNVEIEKHVAEIRREFFFYQIF